MLKFLIIRCFSVIFIQSFTRDARNAFSLVKCTCSHLFRYGQMLWSNRFFIVHVYGEIGEIEGYILSIHEQFTDQ